MFLIYWASAVASIGWAWIADTFADRAGMRDGKIAVLVKRKTRNGLAVTETDTELEYRQPTSIVVLFVVAILSTLPFLATNITSAWLAVLALSILTVLALGLGIFFSSHATPVYIETGRSDAGDGKVKINYAIEKHEIEYSDVLLAGVILPAVVWIIVAWIMHKLGLSGWTLIGMINVVGIALTLVYTILLWRGRSS